MACPFAFFFIPLHPIRIEMAFFIGRFCKLALTDCETIFEVNLFVREGVW